MKDILRGVKTGIEMVKQYAMRDLPLVLVQLVTCCLVFVSYDLVQPLLYTVLFDSISSADLRSSSKDASASARSSRSCWGLSI